MIEKIINIGSDLYTIEIRHGNIPVSVYCLDNFAGKEIKVTIGVEVIE
jgi:hypothetical protein